MRAVGDSDDRSGDLGPAIDALSADLGDQARTRIDRQVPLKAERSRRQPGPSLPIDRLSDRPLATGERQQTSEETLMTITDEGVQLDSAAHTTAATEHSAEDTPTRVRPSKRNIAAIGAAIVVAAGLAVGAVQISGSTRSDGTPVPASRSDDVVRDLVDRGVVPAATLGDGSHITGTPLDATSQSHDEFVRDLVARGARARRDPGRRITDHQRRCPPEITVTRRIRARPGRPRDSCPPRPWKTDHRSPAAMPARDHSHTTKIRPRPGRPGPRPGGHTGRWDRGQGLIATRDTSPGTTLSRA